MGIKEKTKQMLINAPENYMEILEHDASQQLVKQLAKADVVHLFATSRKQLEQSFEKVIDNANENLVLWVSWYKKSSGIATDVTEDVIREVVLPKGWVDIKSLCSMPYGAA